MKLSGFHILAASLVLGFGPLAATVAIIAARAEPSKGQACYQQGLSVGRAQASVYHAQANGFPTDLHLIETANEAPAPGCR